MDPCFVWVWRQRGAGGMFFLRKDHVEIFPSSIHVTVFSIFIMCFSPITFNLIVLRWLIWKRRRFITLIGSGITAFNICNWYYYSGLVVSSGFQRAEINTETCTFCCGCWQSLAWGCCLKSCSVLLLAKSRVGNMEGCENPAWRCLFNPSSRESSLLPLRWGFSSRTALA